MKFTQALRVFISRRLQEARKPIKQSHDRRDKSVSSSSLNKNQHAAASNGSQIQPLVVINLLCIVRQARAPYFISKFMAVKLSHMNTINVVVKIGVQELKAKFSWMFIEWLTGCMQVGIINPIRMALSHIVVSST